jgi:hypothetical protein
MAARSTSGVTQLNPSGRKLDNHRATIYNFLKVGGCDHGKAGIRKGR